MAGDTVGKFFAYLNVPTLSNSYHLQQFEDKTPRKNFMWQKCFSKNDGKGNDFALRQKSNAHRESFYMGEIGKGHLRRQRRIYGRKFASIKHIRNDFEIKYFITPNS